MTWNIRVVKAEKHGITHYEIAEVFYNTHGKPCGYAPCNALEEELVNLYLYVDRMKEAISLPIIEFSNDFEDWDE
jgi:hypothetical protein